MDEVSVFDTRDGMEYTVPLTTRVNGDQVYLALSNIWIGGQ